LLTPTAFPLEADLHDLVVEEPNLLPLSGSPRLTILGREVPLGTGYADVLAVEASGRPVIVEVKLARNAEARRAVVAQVLAYAAFLHRLEPAELERQVLGSALRKRGFASIAEAVSADDQEGAFDQTEFDSGLERHLGNGHFRLVLVLDDAPPELVRLVGYLESVGADFLVDLVTVTAYDVNGEKVIVPQRVDPERPPQDDVPVPRRAAGGYLAEGAEDFEAAIETSPQDHQAALRRLSSWARTLEAEGLVSLKTYHGKGRMTLLPRLVADDAGLVTIWNDNGPYVSLWRSVFERRAPNSIEAVESVAAVRIGNGNVVRELSDEFLSALTAAYREAVVSE
jgi:hypothetical protein